MASDPNGGFFAGIISAVLTPFLWLKAKLWSKPK